MPGWSNADNKYGLTPYIVGPVLGDGCNYDTIQTAIDDAFAAGGGVVGIRAGTYTENLTLRENVELYGFDVDGRLPSLLSHVSIVGNHTFSVAAGFGAQISQYINFSAPAGDVFTMNASAGAQAILAQKFCGIEAFTVPGQRCCVLNADAGGGCQYSTDNTNLNSSGHCFEGIGLGSQAAFISLGSVNSQAGSVYVATAGSNNLTGSTTDMNGNIYVFDSAAGGSCTFEYSSLFAAQEIAIFPVGAGQIDIVHCQVSSSAASGFWTDGTGAANYGDIVFTGGAQDVGPGMTVQKLNWQPYGETSGAAPGSNRGTASFNSADFTAVDGFVSLVGSTTGPVTQISGDTGTATPTVGNINIFGNAGAKTSASGDTLTVQAVGFSEQLAPFAANQDEGYWVDAGVTATLPTTNIVDGTLVIIGANGAGVIVQADVTHSIRLGTSLSIAGGTATSTDIGDILTLRYRAGASQWWAVSSVGNWTVS